MNELVTHSEVSRRRFIAAVAAAALSGGGFATAFNTRPNIALADTWQEVRAEANKVLAELDALQDQLDIKANEYMDAVAEEEAAEEAVADAQRRIEETQAKIDRLKQRLATRARGMYKSGNTSFLDIMFGSTSFSSFVSNVQLLKEMNQDDVTCVEEAKELKIQIQEEKVELERLEAIAEEKRKAAKQIMDEAQALVDEYDAKWRALDREATRLYREEQARIRAAEEAARAAAEAAAQAAAGGGGEGGGSTGGTRGANVGVDWGHNNRNVARAREWVGRGRYVWCACSSDGAFDCSGLVAYAVTGRYQRIGTTWTFWTNAGGLYPDVTDYPQPGDVCVIHNSARQHCGIYTGGSYMIHAASPELGVIEGWFDRNAYRIVRYRGNG